MSLPMALQEMVPVDAQDAALPEVSAWSWTPAVQDTEKLYHAVKANRITTRQTNSKQTDTGTSY